MEMLTTKNLKEENKMEKVRKRLAPELLYGTYSNYDDTVNLEFLLEDYVVYVCRVKVADLNDEFYFDDAETVQKAIDEADDEDIEVYKDGEEILYEDEIELS